MNSPEHKSPYEYELRLATELARAAGALLLKYHNTPVRVEQKSFNDRLEPVTEADRAANELIVRRIAREFPEDGILAEESIDSEDRLRRRRVWMVDPMDGTKSFIAGGEDFAVQIGLALEGESVLGVVYQPTAGVLYRAAKGRGALVERPNQPAEKGQVSDKTDSSEMRLAVSQTHRGALLDRVIRAFGFKEEVRRSSVGIKVGLIVEQRCDLYIHLSPETKQWDTCAPDAILSEAGGRLTDLFGRPLRYNLPHVQNTNGIVATNGAAHQMVIERLAPLLAEFGRAPM